MGSEMCIRDSAFAYTTTDLLSDVVTYLIAFYLMLLVVDYFVPRGVESEIDAGYGDDESLYSMSENVDSSFSLDG